MRERTNQVDIQRDVKVTMPDGAVLLADILDSASLPATIPAVAQ